MTATWYWVRRRPVKPVSQRTARPAGGASTSGGLPTAAGACPRRRVTRMRRERQLPEPVPLPRRTHARNRYRPAGTVPGTRRRSEKRRLRPPLVSLTFWPLFRSPLTPVAATYHPRFALRDLRRLKVSLPVSAR